MVAAEKDSKSSSMRIAPASLILIRAGILIFQVVMLAQLYAEFTAWFAYPVHPSTNLLDPWSTWCPNIFTGGIHNGCFLMSYLRLGGPYGYPWYWTSWVSGGFDHIPYTTGMFAAEVVVALLLYRRGLRKTSLAFTILTVSQFFTNTQNVLSMDWIGGSFLASGRARWALLAAAIVYRIPGIAPWYVWHFALFESSTYWPNWPFNYGLLGALWLGSAWPLLRRQS